MPKQVFDLVDYFGVLVVALIFALILCVLSFFVINWLCITHKDDLTAFEK
uniref:ATP synthase F0 subunit 8 n=1 Tax=Panagrolaimus sp. JU765 TaxID=591449 RepID=A0AC34Q7W4_9BILA